MKRYHDYIKKTALNNEYREECLRKAEYYKLWSNHTAKFSNWTGPQYYEIRAHKERSVREQEEKKTQLTIRRQHLAEKLHQEALLHNVELRELKKKGVISTKELKLRHNELLEKLDADAKSEAELQLYHQWRRDEPAVRMAESEFRRGFARQAWVQQIEAKQKEAAAAKAEADRLHQEQTMAALQAAQAAKLAEQCKREEECRIAQLNAEEAQDRLIANARVAEQLRQEEASAIRLEQELLQLEQERLHHEQQRAQKAFRAKLERQAAFQLRQRATEVQRELEEDLALLRKVHLAMEKENCEQAERQQACRELAATLRAMTQQTQREAALAKLNANIFQEEAMLELRLQEERWQKENAARRSLLASVIAEQQAQIRVARERVAKQKQMLQEECEELNRVTRHHMRLQRAQAEHRAELQHNYKMQLDQQVLENKTRKQQEQEQQRREEEAKCKKASEQAAKLDSELRKIILGQQKVAWL